MTQEQWKKMTDTQRRIYISETPLGSVVAFVNDVVTANLHLEAAVEAMDKAQQDRLRAEAEEPDPIGEED